MHHLLNFNLFLFLLIISSNSLAAQSYDAIWPLLKLTNEVDSNQVLYKNKHIQQVTDTFFRSKKPVAAKTYYYSTEGLLIAESDKTLSEGKNYSYTVYGINSENRYYKRTNYSIRNSDTVFFSSSEIFRYDSKLRNLLEQTRYSQKLSRDMIQTDKRDGIVWEFVKTAGAETYSPGSFSVHLLQKTYDTAGFYLIEKETCFLGKDTLSMSFSFWKDKNQVVKIQSYVYKADGTKGFLQTDEDDNPQETKTWKKGVLTEHTTYKTESLTNITKTTSKTVLKNTPATSFVFEYKLDSIRIYKNKIFVKSISNNRSGYEIEEPPPTQESLIGNPEKITRRVDNKGLTWVEYFSKNQKTPYQTIVIDQDGLIVGYYMYGQSVRRVYKTRL